METKTHQSEVTIGGRSRTVLVVYSVHPKLELTECYYHEKGERFDLDPNNWKDQFMREIKA